MAKKLFDNKIDNTITGMDSDEKKDVKAKLEAARAEMMSNITFEDASLKGHRKNKTVAAKNSVFKTFWNFLKSVIFSVPFKKDSNISIAKIKQVKGRLESLGINFFDFKKDAVTSDFALYILEIYKGAKIIKEIFIDNENFHSREFFVKTFFDHMMSDITINSKKLLSQENIEKIFFDKEIKDKRVYLKEAQSEFLENFKGNDYKNIQGAISSLDHLILIYNSVDFDDFFELFGTFKNSQLDISYTRIEPKKVLNFLKSIGAVSKLITDDNVGKNCTESINYANQKLKESGFTENDKDFISLEVVNKSLLLLRKVIKFDIIDSMLQYITMDEMFLSGFAKGKKIILSKYLDMISVESTVLFNRIEDEKTKELLDKSILDFFNIKNEKELVYAGIYTPKNKKYFETNNVKIMDKIKPLSLVLSFLDFNYETFLRNVINTLVVKGDFIKKLEGEEFSTFYYQLDDTIEKLNIFIKEELTPSETTPNLAVELIEANKELTNVERKTIKTKFSQYDSQIEEFIERMVESLYKIYEFLTKAVEDGRKRYPELISNLKSLRGGGMGAYQSAVEKAVEVIEDFFVIMRNFIVIKSEISNALKNLEKMES